MPLEQQPTRSGSGGMVVKETSIEEEGSKGRECCPRKRERLVVIKILAGNNRIWWEGMPQKLEMVKG